MENLNELISRIPPYEYNQYVTYGRFAVLGSAAFELLLILTGSLFDYGFISKLFFLILLIGTLVVSAFNFKENVDGRAEIQKLLQDPNNEVKGRSAAQLLVPSVAGIFLFLSVSGHFFFSLFVLIHSLAALGQLGIEAYEFQKGGAQAAPAAPKTESANQ